jgi:hypothetical protein
VGETNIVIENSDCKKNGIGQGGFTVVLPEIIFFQAVIKLAVVKNTTGPT